MEKAFTNMKMVISSKETISEIRSEGKENTIFTKEEHWNHSLTQRQLKFQQYILLMGQCIQESKRMDREKVLVKPPMSTILFMMVNG